jgi:hypothetical protein
LGLHLFGRLITIEQRLQKWVSRQGLAIARHFKPMLGQKWKVKWIS